MERGENDKRQFCLSNIKDTKILSSTVDHMKSNESFSNGNDGSLYTKNEMVSNHTENVISKRKRKRKVKKKLLDFSDTVKCQEITNEYKLTSNDYTVYVEGLPYDCKEESLKDFFAFHGCNDVIQLRLPKWQDSGRLRGYGHIVFSTRQSRERALCTVHGKHLNNRYISIQAPKSKVNTTSNKPRKQPKGCVTIYISNIPYDALEDDVAMTLRSFGKIIQGGVRIARNYTSGHSKGFAYVTFKNPEGAYMAVEKASKGDVVIGTRTCYIDYDEGIMRNSYKTKEGQLWKKKIHEDHDTFTKY